VGRSQVIPTVRGCVMRRCGALLVIGALLAACSDSAVVTTTSVSTTIASSTTAAPPTTETPTTLGTTTSEETTTTETLPFDGFTVPSSQLCVIDQRSDDALNVRAGPATDYPVVGTLAYDAVAVPSTGLAASDDQERTWLEVDYGGANGWAAGWLLTPCETGAATTYTVVDTPCPDGLSVRVGPGVEYVSSGELSCNALDVEATGAFAVDGDNRLWRQVRHQGEVGWSAGWLLMPTAWCTDGWITPAEDSSLWLSGLTHIGVSAAGPVDPAEFVVDDMLYCVGPEDVNIIAPRRDVERWYIKGYSTTDPAYRSRWISRRIEIGQGLAWVAPYDSTGFGPGIWEDCYDSDRTGNVAGGFCTPGAGWDPFATSCAAFAPGAWVPGDCDGLPPEVLAGLAGY
jgi:uncharacterized protein YgiM (DUF1202 family)